MEKQQKKLSEEFKDSVSKIEWNKIIGLRNLISHEYEGVDLTIIYNVATINIPEILKNIKGSKMRKEPNHLAHYYVLAAKESI